MDIFEIIKKQVEEKTGFMKHNGIIVEEVKENYTKISCDLDDNKMNHNQTAHGGLIFSLADSAMGIAAITNGKNVCTINAQIDYLKPGTGKKLIAVAEPIKVGKTVSVYKTSIYNEKEDLVATVTGTYYFINEIK